LSLEKGDFLYEGKAKRIYTVTGGENLVWLEFKDSLTAFNAQKKGSFSGKGEINAKIATKIFKFLKLKSIDSHFVESPSTFEMICKKVEIIPLEVVVRNVLAGSTAKRLGIEEGAPMDKPLVEFYFKKDELNDPFVSDDQALFLNAANNQSELDELKKRALQVNEALKEFFNDINITLIDFKLEFGRIDNKRILLADEITPDSCRLWDKETGEKLDKDRFRRDLGRVEESYIEVLNRINTKWENKL